MDQLELVSCLEEPADIAEPEPGVAPEVGTRFMPKGELCLGLCDDACGSEVVRVCTRPGEETKRSTRAEAIEGGDFDRDFGRDVRMGKLPGDPESDSLCWFLAKVGTKSVPSSSDWKRSERRASRSSNRKSGVDR